ncbi:MAG: methyltransferase domain-containing protein [Candidatus Aenigmarchaeota archaeon]|nr:methyltransferase domain-containing protein [Candidatus Aenigmarchaeota archaeon]
MNVIEDLSEFLKISKDNVISKMKKGVFLVKDDWIKANPKTEEEVIKFYKNCKNYLFDLAAWHEQPYKKQWDLQLIEVVKKIEPSVKTILDYGCGIGSNGFLFHEAGFNVTLADLDSFTLDFAKFIIKKYGLPIKVIEVDKEEVKSKFDVIICLDTLEHILDPKTLLEKLSHYLNPEGKIILTITERDEYRPMHYEMKSDFWEYMGNLVRENKILLL